MSRSGADWNDFTRRKRWYILIEAMAQPQRLKQHFQNLLSEIIYHGCHACACAFASVVEWDENLKTWPWTAPIRLFQNRNIPLMQRAYRALLFESHRSHKPRFGEDTFGRSRLRGVVCRSFRNRMQMLLLRHDSTPGPFGPKIACKIKLSIWTRLFISE